MGLRIPSNNTLAKIAVYTAVFGISSAMYMRWKVMDRIRNQDYYKDAMQCLRSNPGAVKLLGEPIKEYGFDLAEPKKSFCDGQKAVFEISVKGSKDKGTLFFSSNRTDEGWILQKLELETKSWPDKRFLLKKSESDEVKI